MPETARPSSEIARPSLEIARLNSKTTQLSSQTARLGSQTTRPSSQTARLGSKTAQLSSETAQLSSETTQLGSKTTQLGSGTTRLGPKTTWRKILRSKAESVTILTCVGQCDRLNYSAIAVCVQLVFPKIWSSATGRCWYHQPAANPVDRTELSRRLRLILPGRPELHMSGAAKFLGVSCPSISLEESLMLCSTRQDPRVLQLDFSH